MNPLKRSYRLLTTVVLTLVLLVTTACSTVAPDARTSSQPNINRSIDYGQLARGDSATGENFGNWVVSTANGLIKDAYVRDSNKLGVVISSQVKPNEVKALAQSLVQGFRRNFPSRDLSVLVYAPDKQLVLTARYNAQSKQVEYQQAS